MLLLVLHRIKNPMRGCMKTAVAAVVAVGLCVKCQSDVEDGLMLDRIRSPMRGCMKTVAAVVAAVGWNVSFPVEPEPVVYPLLPVNQNKMINGSEEEERWGILSLRTR
jgi:hypothetical protein